jgi:enamine deaminase RidA (YjgF/YER057c/UK114 family)
MIAACGATREEPEVRMNGIVTYLNPEGLHRNPAYSQAVVTSGSIRTIYVGGQNAVDATGTVVGAGDIGAQAEQVARNIQVALAAAGARPEHVVKWTVFVVHGQPMEPAISGFQQVLGELPNPPAISVLFVAALANPDFLLEIEAIAVVPQNDNQGGPS